jgi:hypothetical protein
MPAFCLRSVRYHGVSEGFACHCAGALHFGILHDTTTTSSTISTSTTSTRTTTTGVIWSLSHEFHHAAVADDADVADAASISDKNGFY